MAGNHQAQVRVPLFQRRPGTEYEVRVLTVRQTSRQQDERPRAQTLLAKILLSRFANRLKKARRHRIVYHAETRADRRKEMRQPAGRKFRNRMKQIGLPR